MPAVRETIDGNEAVARVAYQLNETIAIYPITPPSPMGEWADQWASERRPNLWGTVPLVVEMQSEAGGSLTPHLCFLVAFGQLELKGALDNFPQTSSDGATQESAEHRDVCRHVHVLRVHLHLNPESDALQPDLAMVSGPLHLLDQGAESALELVDGGLQAFFRLVKRVPMLHREMDKGHGLTTFYVMLMIFFYQL